MSDRTTSLLALGIAIAITAWHDYALSPWMLDDAFIFCRYAENWAAGHGITYNAGEAPVEGSTSFLWMAAVSLGTWLSGDPVRSAFVGGFACAFGTLALVSQSWRWLERIDGRQAAMATLMLGTCGAFMPWARSGMDTALDALLFTALVVSAVRAREREVSTGWFVWIGVLSTLATLSRPNAVLVIAWLAAGAWRAGGNRQGGDPQGGNPQGGNPLGGNRQGGNPPGGSPLGGPRRENRRGLRHGVLVAAATFAVLFGVFYAWRFWYFGGYLLPNTFYAKVGGTAAQLLRGIEYTVHACYALAPLLLIPLLSWSFPKIPRGYLAFLGVAAAQLVYVVLVGGDVMPAHRFFTPIVPSLCVFTALALGGLPNWRAGALLVLTCGYGIAFMARSIEPLIRGDVVAHNGRIAGEWLRKNAPKDAVVATNTAGTVAYYSKLRAIDMLGLNDVHIAHRDMPDMGKGHAGHEKGDGAYVLGRRPEFIQLGSSLGWTPLKAMPLPPFPGDREIWADPRFQRDYKLFVAKGPTLWPGGNPCGYFGFYVRSDVWRKLQGR